MCENVENCCRICLDVESEHVPIFGDPTIHLHIKSCLGMTASTNDGLPRTICVSCVSQLSDFYSLQLNARFSHEWLESCVQEKSKRAEGKPVQPLPDSEYNSDSLLEFLNNTANIEEYLSNLGKEDIPSIVNMLDRNNENSMEAVNKAAKALKISPKKREIPTKAKNCDLNMEIDILDSDIEVVTEILTKETEEAPKKQCQIRIEKPPPRPGKTQPNTEISQLKTEKLPAKFPEIPNACFACKLNYESIHKLSQHLSTCDLAQRTCVQCQKLFDSKIQALKHSTIHNSDRKCVCGKQFSSEDKLIGHQKTCRVEPNHGCMYRCKQCKQTFKQRFQMYKHAREHIIREDERVCDTCGHSFIGDEALVKHRHEIHGESNSKALLYRCKVCTLTSPSHKEMYIHVRKHLENECLDRHLCDTCGKSFKTRVTLLRHAQTHEPVIKKERDDQSNGKVPCHANASCDNNLNLYSKVELNDVKRPCMNGNQCCICQETFDDAKSREEHESEHMEERICEKCGESLACYKMEKHFCE